MCIQWSTAPSQPTLMCMQAVVLHLLDEDRDGWVTLPDLTHLHIIGEEYANQETLDVPECLQDLLQAL